MGDDWSAMLLAFLAGLALGYFISETIKVVSARTTVVDVQDTEKGFRIIEKVM